MNVEQVLRQALQDISEKDSAPVPPDFADRVLRMRRRRRAQSVGTLALALVAVLTAAIAVPALDRGGDGGEAADTVVTKNVLAHPDQSPPRELVAAGETALSAYTVRDNREQPDGDVIHARVWHLYDPATGRYEKTDWAWADVAPGLDIAAVLEGPLPAEHVDIVDLATGEVKRRIPLDHRAGSVYWSPSGDRLLVTTYSKNPDRYHMENPRNVNGKERPGPLPSRTGFAVVDVGSGEVRWTKLPYRVESPFGDETEIAPENLPYFGNGRDDLEWNWDGTLVWEHNSTEPPKDFYDLRGNPAKSPTENHSYSDAGKSPDGRYAAGFFVGEGMNTATVVLDARTGDPVAKQRDVQELIAWADEDTLIAWGCEPGCSTRGEFRQQLLLVDVDGGNLRELTGFRGSQSKDGWTPYFSPR